jgi:alpha-glucosidase
VTTWLPQPKAWKDLTAEIEAGDPGSMLELYRAALHLRRGHPALGEGPLHWEEAPEGVLLFSRTPGFVCAVNLSGAPYTLPAHTDVLLTSGPLDGDALPNDTAVWLAV